MLTVDELKVERYHVSLLNRLVLSFVHEDAFSTLRVGRYPQVNDKNVPRSATARYVLASRCELK